MVPILARLSSRRAVARDLTRQTCGFGYCGQLPFEERIGIWRRAKCINDRIHQLAAADGDDAGGVGQRCEVLLWAGERLRDRAR